MKEFELIKQIRRRTKNDARVILGIGDDTAVMRGDARKDLLLTTDMLIEGHHFRLSDATAYEIGRKALAVNISDIAAMGGLPTHAVVAVGLPAKKTDAFYDGLYRGLSDLAREFGVNVVGGDTNRSDKLVISIALLGEVEKGKAVTRAGARVGDRVFVSGALGGSYRSKKHLRFTPRLKEARWLVKNTRLHAMMDVSDGLASDLRRVAEESGVGFLIEETSLPLTPGVDTRSALGDGEDFELLFTVSEKEAKKLEKRFYSIGRVISKKFGVVLLDKKGKTIPIRGGFDHFQ